MDGFLIAAVLFAALLHASWNALVKIGGDGLLTIFLFKALSAPVAATMLIFTGFPNIDSMPYAFGSGVILLFYCIFLGHAYQNADFSLVYPVARGVAPPAVALLAMVFVGEALESSVFIGTAIVSIGILLLTYARRIDHKVMLGLVSAAGVGITIAAYTLVDGIGARRSGDAIAYIAFLKLATFFAAWHLRDGAAASGRRGIGSGRMAERPDRRVHHVYGLWHRHLRADPRAHGHGIGAT